MTAEERFEALVVSFNDTEGVTPPTRTGGFGRSALRYRGKIFAMFVRGRLVVKLPHERVTELVEAGRGEHFDANKGTPMREWFAAAPDETAPDETALDETALDETAPGTPAAHDDLWEELAAEALAFARSFAPHASEHDGPRPGHRRHQ